MGSFRRGSGNWSYDRSRGTRSYMVLGMVAIVAVPILLLTIVVLVVVR